MASDLQQRVLEALDESNGPLSTVEAFPNVPFEEIKAILDRLGSREYVKYEQLTQDQLVLSAEGKDIVENGSHEARVFEAVRKAVEGIKIKDLSAAVGATSAKVGQGNAMKAKWIKKDGETWKATTDSITDTTREHLKLIQEQKTHPDAKVAADLKKRKLVEPKKIISFKVEKGSKYSKDFVKQETDLTADMLASGAWKTVELKPYNFKALGAQTPSGALHPLNKVRAEFRNIFFEMGFTEMPTSNFVESGFWNFDALFVPQQHPARDQQDTFFIKDPVKADRPGPPPAGEDETTQKGEKKQKQHTAEAYKQYWDDVHAVHQDGKFGSIGYRYPWSADESLRLVLRTHTTATSAYMLHKLAADPKPVRLFSIDRVFRNETVDATHLAEFHQVEGVIADYNLTLGGLIAFMETFYERMGITNLRFKPAYNPYTEPSMEIFGYHEGLKRWVEIGNSGMFRPEMLLPMGLPKDLRVYGWGLSLERPTMIKYGVNNIRELLGHKVDLNFIESNPAVRLEKN